MPAVTTAAANIMTPGERSEPNTMTDATAANSTPVTISRATRRTCPRRSRTTEIPPSTQIIAGEMKFRGVTEKKYM